MGEAREVMDRLTHAVVGEHSLESAAACYADDAMMITPDAGEIRGRDNIAEYWRPFVEGFQDADYQAMRKLEAGDTAIDEGWFIGTNTGSLPLPSGEVLPATGRQVRFLGCDLATVRDGKIKEHHFYYDQLEFLGQLGLAPPTEPPG
jgi:ketosteroid isomerase-like protein